MVDPWLAKVWEGRTMPGADEDPIRAAVWRLRGTGRGEPLPDIDDREQQPLRYAGPPPRRHDGVTYLLAFAGVVALAAIVVAIALLQGIFR